MTVKFDATYLEHETIIKIAKRAEEIAGKNQIEISSRMHIVMDIEATHCNGCRLKLDELLAFPDFDFVHDVWGIMRHLDRETGQLTNCFLPRCSAPEAVA